MSLALSTTLHTSFEDAVERTRKALADQGFGVLTEIDMKATLKAKLGRVRQINAMDSGRPPAPVAMRAMAMEADSGAAATYQTGDIRFESRVNASFDLK